MTIERIFQIPRKWTFQQPKLRNWIEERLEGPTLNLFGGMTLLTHTYHIAVNDINPEVDPHMSKDACDLTQWIDHKAAYQTVIFDPPYSDFQAVKTYGAKKAQKVSHARDVVEYVLAPGGRVISLGWNSTGMSAGRGFQKEALLLINHGGSHNDTIVLCERQIVGESGQVEAQS